MLIMKKVGINEMIKEIKERNDEVCVGNTRLVKVFSYRLTTSFSILFLLYQQEPVGSINQFSIFKNSLSTKLPLNTKLKHQKTLDNHQ